MGYALPRPVRRWLEGQIAGLREPLKLAIIRLANLVGRYHTGPKVGGRDFCLARQPKRKGRELDGGILTNPEMAGVSEHYFRLARQHLIHWGFLAIARPSDRAFKSKRLSHHAPSGWRCPATLYKIGARFALQLGRTLPAEEVCKRAASDPRLGKYRAAVQAAAEMAFKEPGPIVEALSRQAIEKPETIAEARRQLYEKPQDLGDLRGGTTRYLRREDEERQDARRPARWG